MSQYSETMGSFIRTGNYPLEANYIFPTEAELKEFYEDPINATTIHKGLLKIVENGGNGKQALYWVTKKQTNDELEFVKLIENLDVSTMQEQLTELSEKLDKEIKDRKSGETAIWGTNDPTNIPENLNSILDLANSLSDLISKVDKYYEELTESDNTLKTELKATVGTEEIDLVTYLQTLPYKSLSEVSVALNKFLNTVDSESNQINTLPELKFFLEGYNDSQKLRNVLLDLKGDISGTPLPSKDFETLRAIEDFVRVFKTDAETTDKNLQSELDNTQIGVGLSGDGSYNADQETYYLKEATSVMNALKTLDKLVYEALKGITITVEDDQNVALTVRKEPSGYVIGGSLNLSNTLGNDLVKKTDGLYFHVTSEYSNGILTLYVNDKIAAQHILGFSSIVESAYYDSSNESIVIVFKLLDGEKQTINIPVGTLIRELEVYNGYPEKVVELTREVVIDGADKLSADVRIYSDKHNILKKVGNALSVDGTTDSITHNDTTLSEYLKSQKESQDESIKDLNTKIDELNLNAVQLKADLSVEAQRAESAENVLNSAIETEKERAKSQEELIVSNHNDLATKLSEEIERSTAKDTELASDIKNIHIPQYTIVKQSTPEDNCLATYYLTKDEELVGNKIDIPALPIKINAIYEKGIFTLFVNDLVVGSYNFSLDAAVKESYFDSNTNELVVEYNLHSGETQIVKTSFQYIIDQINNTNKVLSDFSVETNKAIEMLNTAIGTVNTNLVQAINTINGGIATEIQERKDADAAEAKTREESDNALAEESKRINSELQKTNQVLTDFIEETKKSINTINSDSDTEGSMLYNFSVVSTPDENDYDDLF